MNWDKKRWMCEANDIRPIDYNVFSNINHTWYEFMSSGPFGVKLNNMAEANQASLRLYRQACRFVPSLLNRQTTLYTNDYHMSKRILAQWFRRGKNMRNLNEISVLHKTYQEFLFDAAYCNVDCGWYNKYLHEFPEMKDGLESQKKTVGLDLALNKFKGKTRFFEKFIKGTRHLMK